MQHDKAFTIGSFVPADLDGFRQCLQDSYLRDFPEDLRGIGRPRFEPGRSIVAHDGGRVVGTTSSYELLIETPMKARVPAAGISLVSVLPTHRGRGIMNALLLEQLHRLKESGSPLAALWASQAALYPRYGFGLAVAGLDLVVPSRTAFLETVESDVGLEFCSIEAALDAGSELYACLTRPGWLALEAAEWRRRRGELVADADGTAKAVRVVDEANRCSGVAVYSAEAAWAAGEPRGRIEVHDLLAEDGRAYAAIWRFLLAQDWVSEIHARNRPIDEPLLALVANPRSLHTRFRDALFLRILDVERSLQARTYERDVECVLQIRDRLLDENSGTWVLRVKDGEAQCMKDPRAAPQVTLGIDALGAAFLGGFTFSSLYRAGRVSASDACTISALDRTFRTPVAPNCPFVF